MRGQVLGVDLRSGEGQIAGVDGQRYVFRREDWSDRTGPAVGATVDFETDDRRALRIYHLPQATPGQAAVPRGVNRKDRIATALLAFFLGIFGIHRFYLGRIGSGIVMLVLTCTLIGVFATSVWALVDFVRYLVMSEDEFHARYSARA